MHGKLPSEIDNEYLDDFLAVVTYQEPDPNEIETDGTIGFIVPKWED